MREGMKDRMSEWEEEGFLRFEGSRWHHHPKNYHFYDSSPPGLFFYLLFPRLCLGLIIFKAFSLEASKMLLFGAFAPIPKGSNMNSPVCNAGKPEYKFQKNTCQSRPEMKSRTCCMNGKKA
jgi:hypothetical protein